MTREGRWSALTRPHPVVGRDAAISAAPAGIPLRQDYEYRREGVRNLFLACEPKTGWRHVAVTERRTMQDFAHQMRWLVDEAYPEVEVVRVVPGQLEHSPHGVAVRSVPGSGGPADCKRLEFHYTPSTGVG